jgi:DNA-directed RNA polymerase subunit M/transcription elongation factor TFIIS
MESIVPAEEWRRVQEQYAHMNDDELQGVADEAYELTEIAQQVLQAEISGRGLDIKLRSAPVETAVEPEECADDFDPSELNLTVVHRVWDLAEARQAKNILNDAGIPSYLGQDNVENVDEFKSTFDGGVDLRVREVDSQRAMRALAESIPLEPDDDAEYISHCPKCHSPEIVFQGLDTEAARSAFESKFNWRCDACGHQWKDDGIEQEA